MNQRWRQHCDSYRPAGEVIDPRRYEVASIPDDTTAKAFVLAHHYSGTFPAARFRFGLYAIGGFREDSCHLVDRSEGLGARLPSRRCGQSRGERKGSQTDQDWRLVAQQGGRRNDLSTASDHENHDAEDQRLVGVAVFSHPCNDAVLTNTFTGVPALEAAELGRFVLLDQVPGNGETWFLARCFDLLRRLGLAGIVSFSDPAARTLADGQVVFGGHVGTIYQAFNGHYLGRGRARKLRLLPDGRTLNDRTIAKLKAGHRGWRAAVDLLVGYGATEPSGRESISAWADGSIDRLTRIVRHQGNHR